MNRKTQQKNRDREATVRWFAALGSVPTCPCNLIGCVIALVFTFSGPGQAATISNTQPLSGSSGTVNSDLVKAFTPGFDNTLGTLTGVSLTLNGQLSGAFFFDGFPPPTTPPFNVVFQNVVYAYPGGQPYIGNKITLPSSTGIVANVGGATMNSVGINFKIDIAPSAFIEWTSGGNVESDFQFYSTATDAASAPVMFGDYEDAFKGSVIETFTYTPIPEPSSLALLGSGLLGLVTMVFLRRRRQAWTFRNLPVACLVVARLCGDPCAR